MHARRGSSFVRPALAFVSTWAVLTGLWLLYTSELQLYELLAGIAAGFLGTVGTAIVWGQDFARFGPKLGWLLYLLLEPWFVLQDTAIVYWAAFKRLFGAKPDSLLQTIGFDAGASDNHKDAARRSLATTLATIPPNTIVIGIDTHQQVLVLHYLAGTEVPWVLRQLGAKS